MSYAVLDRAANVRTHGGSGNRLDLGLLPLRYLLANSRSLGNQSDRISAEPSPAVNAAHGKPTTAPAGLDNFRAAVGCDCVDEYRSALHASVLPALAALSLAAGFPPLHWGSGMRLDHYPGYHSLAGAQLRCRRKIRIHSRQPSPRNAHGQ